MSYILTSGFHAYEFSILSSYILSFLTEGIYHFFDTFIALLLRSVEILDFFLSLQS